VEKLADQVRHLSGEKAARDAEDAARKEKKLRDNGEYEKLIKERDDKLAALAKRLESQERKVLDGERDRALTAALAGCGVQLCEGSADQLHSLWRHDFETRVDEDGSYKVLTKDFRSPADVVKERLAETRYRMHVSVTARAKNPSPGAQRSVDTPNGQAQGQRPNLYQRILDQIEARKAGAGPAEFERPAGLGGRAAPVQ
jgi:hypothetical protein